MKIRFAFEARFTVDDHEHCGYIRFRQDSLSLEMAVGRASSFPLDPTKIAKPAYIAIDRVAAAFGVDPNTISMIPVPLQS